jgi:hypothetical protein
MPYIKATAFLHFLQWVFFAVYVCFLPSARKPPLAGVATESVDNIVIYPFHAPKIMA